MDATFWIALVVFTLTYFGLAVGRFPGLRMDRAAIALVGGVGMLATGTVSFGQAVSPACINFEALALLFGMMIVVGILRLSGFFERLTAWCLARIRSPRVLLAVTITLSGVLSAFLVNDIVCIALTPLILGLTRKLGFQPAPHLIGLATAANIGSTATITGNPQNMIIGIHSRISYLRFAERLFPVALFGMVVTYLLLAWMYRPALAGTATLSSDVAAPRSSRLHLALQRRAVLVTLGAVVLFFVLPGHHLAIIALGAAAVLLIGRINPEKIYRQVDWTLLILFTGLFIVVYGFRIRVVSHWGVEGWTWLIDRPVDVLSGISAILSNLVSNVPAVLLFQPILEAVPPQNQETAWLALAMSSTLAGNLTLLGSVANLIVVEYARREGVEISFVEYARVGVPLTLITLAQGVAWLLFVRY